MSSRSSPKINDLIEINHEIAALIRANVPLELGLRSIAGGAQTSFDVLAERLADHISGGRTLAEAFAHETHSISPVYAAVVEAGTQTNRLPEALDSVANSAKVVQEIRQRVGLAMIYPLACLIVAIPLATGVISILAPIIKSTLEDIRTPADSTIEALYKLYQTRTIWSVQIPLALLCLITALYAFRSGPTRSLWLAITGLNWLPGFRRLQFSLRRSQFLELLALQTEFGIPLEQAFPRAASVTESTKLKSDADQIATTLKSGRSLREAFAETTSIPPSWKWVLLSSQETGQLPVSIRQLSESCRLQALQQSAWFNMAVPTALALTCSAVIVLGYMLMVLLPIISIWKGLDQP
ncbi:MAG: type II secretion system F family protein [Planctomycetaceae bacterium]